MLNDIGQSSKSWLARFASLFLLFTIIYFPMMVTFPLTIDAEFAAVSTDPLVWLAQGRWTTYLVTRAFFQPVVPYLTIAFFGICAAISYTVLARACDNGFRSSMLVGFGVFIGFPVWSTLLEFPANTPSAGVALLLCALAAAALVDKPLRPFLFIGQVLAVAIAIGAYQSFVLVYLVLALTVAYHRHDREAIRLLAVAAIVAVAGVIVHFSIQTISLRLAGMSSAYIGNFFKPSLLLADPWAVIVRSIDTVARLYLGSSSMFGFSIWAAPALVALALAISAGRSLVSVLLVSAALAAPLPLAAMAGGWLPIRSLIAVPVVMGFCALICVSSKWRFARYTGGALAGLLILQSAAAISQYQAQRDLTAKFDQTAAANLYGRIGEAAGPGPYQVDFFGALQPAPLYAVIPSSTAGASFFSWDNGNPWRMLAFMRMLGYADLSLAPNDVRELMKAEFATMPKWPATDSVRKVGGTVLVKLGDQPGLYAD